MNNLFEAGKIDGKFVNLAVKAGHPYTTRPLITLSAVDKISEAMIDNAADRARAYLPADEIQLWREGVGCLAGRKPTDEERAMYSLGMISGQGAEK